METIFRKVMCSDRLPMKVGQYYLTDIGNSTFWGDDVWLVGIGQNNPTWWLEEVSINTIKADAWEEGRDAWSNFCEEYALRPIKDKAPDEPTNPYK
jgi:hypothetical protein